MLVAEAKGGGVWGVGVEGVRTGGLDNTMKGSAGC